MDPVTLLAGMFVSQEMPGLVLDHLSQLSDAGLHGQASLRKLITENKREVAAILVFHIDLLSHTTERSILRERRVTSSDVNSGVWRDQALPRSGEGDTHPGKAGIQCTENGTDDRCFLTGQFARCAERFNFDVLHSNRPVVGDSHSPIEVEIKHLCAHKTGSVGMDHFRDQRRWTGLSRCRRRRPIGRTKSLNQLIRYGKSIGRNRRS